MESIVKYDSKPVLKDPILIEALPGIGNVGKVAGDHLAQLLKAERFAVIYSMNFPAQVIPGEDNVIKMACNELWHAKTPSGQDLVFLRGDYQGSTPEGQFILAQDILEITYETPKRFGFEEKSILIRNAFLTKYTDKIQGANKILAELGVEPVRE